MRNQNRISPRASDKLIPKKDEKKPIHELKMTTDLEWWTYVDNLLIKAIENYKEIHIEINGQK